MANSSADGLHTATTTNPIQPDVYSYAAAISACERGGEARLALDVFGRMQKAGVKPNTIAYNVAIRSAATRELWPASLSLFQDMRDDGFRLTTDSYNAALAACERGGAWEEAAWMLREMEETGVRPDLITYHTAIATTRTSGQRVAALFAVRLVRRMMGPEAMLTPSVIGFTTAMAACNGAPPVHGVFLKDYERCEW